MNVSDRTPPWEKYVKYGGGQFIEPETDPTFKGGFRLRAPGVPAGTPTVGDQLVSMDKMMGEFKRRPAPKRPGGFDIKGELERLGPAPQRPSLPERQAPQQNLLGGLLAGASDVFAAAAGRRGNALEKMQGLARQQADTAYGDLLRKNQADFDNAQAGWQFQLSKLGMAQADSDRGQRMYESDRAAHFAEDDRYAADFQREMDRLRQGKMDVRDDSRYQDLQKRLAEGMALQREGFAFQKEEAGANRGFRDRSMKMQEAGAARDAELFPMQKKAYQFQVDQQTGNPAEFLMKRQFGLRGDTSPTDWLKEQEKLILENAQMSDAEKKQKLLILDTLANGSPGLGGVGGVGGAFSTSLQDARGQLIANIRQLEANPQVSPADKARFINAWSQDFLDKWRLQLEREQSDKATVSGSYGVYGLPPEAAQYYRR